MHSFTYSFTHTLIQLQDQGQGQTSTMSFFKKDYSAYPQPVIVTPDPRDSAQDISAAVAEAIDSTHPHSHSHSQTTTDSLPKDTKDQHPDTQQDTSSQQTGTGGDGLDSQQQKDTTTRLADGIMSLLGPVVQEMDFNIVSVRKSQSELEKEIERLMAGMPSSSSLSHFFYGVNSFLEHDYKQPT